MKVPGWSLSCVWSIQTLTFTLCPLLGKNFFLIPDLLSLTSNSLSLSSKTLLGAIFHHFVYKPSLSQLNYGVHCYSFSSLDCAEKRQVIKRLMQINLVTQQPATSRGFVFFQVNFFYYSICIQLVFASLLPSSSHNPQVSNFLLEYMSISMCT